MRYESMLQNFFQMLLFQSNVFKITERQLSMKNGEVLSQSECEV